jgi:uncharacterized membrane protein
MNELPEWHPIAVHFPLALIVTAAFALSAARLKAMQRLAATLAVVGTWNLGLGAIGALLAVFTGMAAVIHLQVGATVRAAVALHVKWAILTTVGVLLLAAWRGAGNAQDSRPSKVFLVVLWAVTAALVVTGYRGGLNVYRYGVGVAAATQVNAAPPPGVPDHEQNHR